MTATRRVPPTPPGFEDVLSPYGPVAFDSYCGEPVAWGFKLQTRLAEDRYDALCKHGKMTFVDPSQWVLVLRHLTRETASKVYGPLTAEERGPRGGFISVTFGTKTFATRYLKD